MRKCALVGALPEAVPSLHDQLRARKGQDWPERERETPPVHRACRQEEQGQDSAAPLAAPDQSARQAFQQAHHQETDQQRHGCRQTVVFEWAATIRWKSHDVRDIAAGEQIGNRLDAWQAKACAAEPQQQCGESELQRDAYHRLPQGAAQRRWRTQHHGFSSVNEPDRAITEVRRRPARHPARE